MPTPFTVQDFAACMARATDAAAGPLLGVAILPGKMTTWRAGRRPSFESCCEPS
jgi:hypothetical protein